MKARIGPLGKLDCLHSKKKYFQLKNGTFLTSFRGGPILSLPLLLIMISTVLHIPYFSGLLLGIRGGGRHLWHLHERVLNVGLVIRISLFYFPPHAYNNSSLAGKIVACSLGYGSMQT